LNQSLNFPLISDDRPMPMKLPAAMKINLVLVAVALFSACLANPQLANGYQSNGPPAYQLAALGPGQTFVVPGQYYPPMQSQAGFQTAAYQVAQIPQQYQQPPFQQPFPQQYPQQFPQVQPGYTPQNYLAPSPYPCGYDTVCQLLWTVQLNALYMTRGKSSSFPLLLDGGGATVINADQLDFGWETGFDVALSRRWGDNLNIELRYFQIDGWDAMLSSPFVATDALATNPPSPFGAAGTVDYFYESSIRSAEINLVNRLLPNESFRLSLGFRWMQISENLSQTFSPAAAVFDIDTGNNLYGLQLGGDAVLYRGILFNVAGWIKSGIYANVADQSTSIIGGPAVSNGIGETTPAFVGETGLLADFALTQSISLFGGYQLLWVSGAALAADQLPNMSSVLTGLVPTGLDQSDVFYHGAIFGVDIHW
jgi:hypothetical protein